MMIIALSLCESVEIIVLLLMRACEYVNWLNDYNYKDVNLSNILAVN